MSRVESKISRVESKMSAVEGIMSRVESKMARVENVFKTLKFDVGARARGPVKNPTLTARPPCITGIEGTCNTVKAVGSNL